MTETLFTIVSDWGAASLFLVTFLSCLAIPVPTSLMLLSAGALIASGDLAAPPALTGALLGAILGDQVGFRVGQGLGSLATDRRPRSAARARLFAQADRFVAARGALALFLSRWLFSPLGPYVNVIAGAAGMAWLQFTAISTAGEAVWVLSYTGLGFVFSGQISAIASIIADSVGLLSSGLVAALTGAALLGQARRKRAPS